MRHQAKGGDALNDLASAVRGAPGMPPIQYRSPRDAEDPEHHESTAGMLGSVVAMIAGGILMLAGLCQIFSAIISLLKRQIDQPDPSELASAIAGGIAGFMIMVGLGWMALGSICWLLVAIYREHLRRNG